MAEPLRFEVEPSEPLRLIVTLGGKRYRVTVALAVSRIEHTGRTVASAEHGLLPEFNLKTTPIVETEPIGG